MTAIGITDLNNAKLDVDHIAEISNSTALTATNRYGSATTTVAGAIFRMLNFVDRGAWAAITAYAVKDLVSVSGTWYVAVVAHTSAAAFATDTATKWRVYQGLIEADLAVSTMSANIGHTPTGGVATTVKAKFGEYVSVLDYMSPTMKTEFYSGAPTGDMSAAFIAASAASLYVDVPGGGVYIVDEEVAIRDNQTWVFYGARIKNLTNTKTIFRANTKTGWSLLGAAEFTGTLVAAATTTERGVYITEGKRYRVEGIRFKSFGGKGLHLDGASVSGTRGDRGQFSGVCAVECTVGIQIDAGSGAEYNAWANTNVSGCVTGLIVGAGNQTFVGGNVVDNATGIRLVAGSNHGHGMFSGTNINHNTVWGVETVNVDNGYTFANCHIYGEGAGAGGIFLNNSKGIQFLGGILDARVYNYAGGLSGMNTFKDMYMPGGYSLGEFFDVSSGRSAEVFVTGCYGPGSIDASGINQNDPSQVYVNVRREPGAFQAVTSSTQLIFPTEQTPSDRCGAYDTTTGTFTCPSGEDGYYNLKASIILSGSALVAAQSFVYFKVGSLSYNMMSQAMYLTDYATFTANTDFYLSAGQTVTVLATGVGTAVQFGASGWISTLSIQKIS